MFTLKAFLMKRYPICCHVGLMHKHWGGAGWADGVRLGGFPRHDRCLMGKGVLVGVGGVGGQNICCSRMFFDGHCFSVKQQMA